MPGHALLAGGVTVKVLPLQTSGLRAHMRPPRARMMPPLMESPEPAPPGPSWLDGREKGWKCSGRSSAPMPLPCSATLTTACSPPAAHVDHDVPAVRALLDVVGHLLDQDLLQTVRIPLPS